MKIKRILAVLTAAATLSLGMASCNTDSKPMASTSGNAKKTYKIGIVQLVEHQALDTATEGFKKAVTDELGEANVEFDFQNAQGESTNCTTIVTKFISNKVDLIMANATPALQAAAIATRDIPIVGTSVTDYKTAGVVDDDGNPIGNVTGASDLAPIDKQIALLQKVCPNAKKVGILYCSSEPNSKYQSDLAQKYLKEAGIESKVYTASDTNDIQTVATKAANESDAIYIPTDNTMASNMKIVKNITVPKKLPVICGEENMTKSGGLATLSISYYDMGYAAGKQAVEILKGKAPKDVPISYVSENIVEKYNPEVAKSIGWTIPDDMTAIEMGK